MGKHSEEPKLNLGKVFIVIVILIAIIAGAVYFVQRNKNVNNDNNVAVETPKDEETSEDSSTTETTLNNNSTTVEETTEQLENQVKDPKQQEAIEKAKEFREKDEVGTEKINYEIDSVSDNGKIITVIARDPETTRIVMFYDVNTETGEVTEH